MAVVFTDTAQNINFGDIPALDAVSALTVCGHVRFTSFLDFPTVIGNVTADQNNGWSLQQGGPGAGGSDDMLITTRNAGVILGFTSDNWLALNIWYWVAMIYDGGATGNSNRLKFYVDDVQKTLSFNATIPASIGAADAVCIGNNEAGTEGAADMIVEDWKCYNVVLTPIELAGLRRGRMVRHEALKLWPGLWGTHDPEIDLSPTKATGTLTGSPTRGNGPSRTLYTPKWAAAALSGAHYLSTVSGSLATAGGLNRQAGIAKVGTVTTVGALVKQTSKLFAGTVTTAGALTAIKTALKQVGGTLATAGTLLKQARLSLAGTLTAAGALLKQTARSVAGTLSTAGAIAAIKAALKSVTGTLATAGALLKQARANPAGTLMTAGTVNKETRRAVVSTLSTAGTLARQAGKLLAGTVSASGVVRLLAHKLMTAALGVTGQLVKQLRRDLAGTLTAGGSVSGVITALLFNLIGFLFGRGAVSRYSGVAASVSTFAGSQGQVSRIEQITGTF